MSSKDNNDFQATLTMLEMLLNKSKVKKKKITDNDLKNADLEAIQKHTIIYTDYLKKYVDDYKRKLNAQYAMKWLFFGVTIILLTVMIIGGIIVICNISKKPLIKPSDVATVITATFGAVSSFLILPKVIAENLFPSKEEDKTAQIFEKMFEHDINLRGMYHVSDNTTGNQSAKCHED